MVKTTWFTVVIIMLTMFAGGAAWGRQEAKKGYMIVQVDVTDPQRYGEYAKLTPAIIAKFGGRFLARAGRTATLEGPSAPGRVVIIEFDSFERAQAFYNSAEYQAAKKLRSGAGSAQFVAVEGL